MQSPAIRWILLTMALLALVIAALVHFLTSTQSSSKRPQIIEAPGRETAQKQDTYIPPVRASGHAEAAEEGIGTPAKPKIPAISGEQIEAYLKLHGRNAASLLAAFHASGGDTNYLMEAAMNFPNNPHVQLSVLSHDLFPGDRRKWLDAFKASSPDNSLANYLSAQNYFENNQPAAAIQEMSDAYGKDKFTDFALENFRNAADLYQYGGLTDFEVHAAAMAAMAEEMLPLLAEYKRVAMGAMDYQKQYVDAGDTTSVENLSQLSLALADRFYSRDGGRYLVEQLVGMAIENISLRSLDQNTPYDFLDGETPTERIAELKQLKTEASTLVKDLAMDIAMMSEPDQKIYFDKVNTNGEMAALRWLYQSKHPTSAPTSP